MIWSPGREIWTPPYRKPLRYDAASPVPRRRSIGSSGGIIGTPPPNPDAFWRMEDATDSSGNMLDLTNVGSTPFNPGKIGNAADFNGSSMCFTHADTALLRASGSISLCMWIYPRANGTSSYGVTKWTSGLNAEYVVSIGGSVATVATVVSWVCYDSSSLQAQGGIQFICPDTTWSFLAMTFDGARTPPNNIGISFNGSAFDYSNSLVNTISDIHSSNSLFCIGTINGFGPGTNFTPPHMLDAIGLWHSYALVDAEAAYLYNAGSGKEFYASAWH